MKQWFTFIKFLVIAIRAYRDAAGCDAAYGAVVTFGIPRVTVLVATEREAWRVSQLAIEACKGRAN